MLKDLSHIKYIPMFARQLKSWFFLKQKLIIKI